MTESTDCAEKTNTQGYISQHVVSDSVDFLFEECKNARDGTKPQLVNRCRELLIALRSKKYQVGSIM